MTAWKDLERRVCRALGADRRPSMGAGGYARGSDDDGSAPFSVECKRTQRYGLRRSWIEQARRNGRADGRPWLLVIAEHGDRRPIAVVDFWAFAQLVEEAGRLPSATERRADHFALGRDGGHRPPPLLATADDPRHNRQHIRARGLAMSTSDPHRPEQGEEPRTDPDTDRDDTGDEPSTPAEDEPSEDTEADDAS